MPRLKRNGFNLSSTRLMTFSLGELVPIGLEEVLPGDLMVHRSRMISRLSTLVKPVMHRVKVDVWHFFVPTRIIWDDWETFITNKTTPTYPTLTMPASSPGWDLCEYLGAPTELGGTVINALPIRAYNKVYNEFFRDQDLITAVAEDSTTLQKASWAKDYFTTCRPNPQQGAAVTFDLAGRIPVHGIAKDDQSYPNSSWTAYETDASASTTYSSADAGTGSWVIEEDPNNTGYPNIHANLDAASVGITIEDWRRAMGLQRFAELRQRFGSRYTDYLRMLGVSPGDQRLQRPERLGHERGHVAFSEVLATGSEGAVTDLGDLAGHGISAVGRRKYRAFFPEHGYVISLAAFRPIAIYANAVPRHWLYRTYDDYFQPELTIEGPQKVTNQEVKADHATPTGTFGYAERFQHLRFGMSQVMGLFKTTETGWHFARDFASDPALNQTFVECVPPT